MVSKISVLKSGKFGAWQTVSSIKLKVASFYSFSGLVTLADNKYAYTLLTIQDESDTALLQPPQSLAKRHFHFGRT